MHTLKATCTRCGKQDTFITTKEGYRCICGNYVPYRIDQPLTRNQALAAIFDGMILQTCNGDTIGHLHHGPRFQSRFVYISRMRDVVEECMGFDIEDYNSYKCIGVWKYDDREYRQRFAKIKNIKNGDLQMFEVSKRVNGFEFSSIETHTYAIDLN